MLVVHYGKTIVEWRKAGYHLQEDQQAFRCNCTAWQTSQPMASVPFAVRVILLFQLVVSMTDGSYLAAWGP